MKRLLTLTMLIAVISSCKTYLPDFPRIEPEIINQVFLSCWDSDGKVAECEARCLARCFDYAEVSTVDPIHCGLPEGSDWSWWADPISCDTSIGPINKAWSERVLPTLNEQRRYLEDYDLKKARDLIQEIIDESNK